MIRGKSLAQYNKTFAALILALLTWAGVVVTSDSIRITASEWLSLGGGLAAALGVYAIANTDESADDKGQVNWVAVAAIAIIVLVVVILVASYDFSATER